MCIKMAAEMNENKKKIKTRYVQIIVSKSEKG